MAMNSQCSKAYSVFGASGTLGAPIDQSQHAATYRVAKGAGDRLSVLGVAVRDNGERIACHYDDEEHELSLAPLSGQANPTFVHATYLAWAGAGAVQGRHFGHSVQCLGSAGRSTGQALRLYYCASDNEFCVDDVS